MPYIRQWVEPATFHQVHVDEHGVRVEANEDTVAVTIRHAYKGEHEQCYWFNADPSEYDGDIGPWDFDIRKLADSLGFARPEGDDAKRLVIDRAVLAVLEGFHWDDYQSSRAIAHAIWLAGESAANAVPTRS